MRRWVIWSTSYISILGIILLFRIKVALSHQRLNLEKSMSTADLIMSEYIFEALTEMESLSADHRLDVLIQIKLLTELILIVLAAHVFVSTLKTLNPDILIFLEGLDSIHNILLHNVVLNGCVCRDRRAINPIQRLLNIHFIFSFQNRIVYL